MSVFGNLNDIQRMAPSTMFKHSRMHRIVATSTTVVNTPWNDKCLRLLYSLSKSTDIRHNTIWSIVPSTVSSVNNGLKGAFPVIGSISERLIKLSSPNTNSCACSNSRKRIYNNTRSRHEIAHNNSIAFSHAWIGGTIIRTKGSQLFDLMRVSPSSNRAMSTSDHISSATMKGDDDMVTRRTQKEVSDMAKSVLCLKQYPIGTFTANEYSQIKIILYYYIHLDKPTTKESVNQPIDALVRLAQEVSHVVSLQNNAITTETETSSISEISTTENNNLDDSTVVTSQSNAATYEWILNANYYNPIITTWKNASVKNDMKVPGIYTGLDLIQKVQYMSKILPPTIYKINIITITMILQVIIKQVRRAEAPLICEKLLSIMSEQLVKQQDIARQCMVKNARLKKDLESYSPNIYSYNILLKAWSESRLPNAQEKIESILVEMKDLYNIDIGYVSYSIILRFYSRMGNVQKVNELLQDMQTKNLRIDVDCLTQALLCCCRANEMDNAHQILQMIIHQHPPNEERTKGLHECLHHLLKTYWNQIDKALVVETTNRSVVNINDHDDIDNAELQDKFHEEQPDVTALSKEIDELVSIGIEASEKIQTIVARAEELVNIVISNKVLDNQGRDRLFQIMLELYIKAGFLTNAKELVRKEFPKSQEAHHLLLSAYCHNNQCEVASRMLYDMLQNNESPKKDIFPNTEMFNVVIEAWGKRKSIEDAYDQAYTLYDTLNNYPKCQKHNIRPNIFTYHKLLKCILSLQVFDGAAKAEAILDELENTYNKNFYSDDLEKRIPVASLVKPDIDIYILVMKAWIQLGNDAERALAIIQRMERNANILPNQRMYNSLIQHYCKVGDESAAESADHLFKVMKKSLSEVPSKYSYKLVQRAWLQSGSSKTPDKLWLLYREMVQNNIDPDQTLYTQLIQSLISKKEESYIHKAKTILNDLEAYHQSLIIPTHYTMIIMAYLENDDTENAIEVLSKMVSKLGHKNRSVLPILSQIVKVWIDRGHCKKATMIVNALQEYHELGLIEQGATLATLESLKLAWTSSQDPDKDFIIEQIDEIIRHKDTNDLKSAISEDIRKINTVN